ncbi:hypothetical protein SMICM17S_06670 [Streptomyces microflavus]
MEFYGSVELERVIGTAPRPRPPRTPATAKLQEEFAKLDCTDPEQRTAAGKDALPTASIVACGSRRPPAAREVRARPGRGLRR